MRLPISVKENGVVYAAELPDSLSSLWSFHIISFRRCLRPEHRVHQDLQIVARGRIAVQIDRSRLFQHAMKFDQARGHHGEIGHHVAVAEEGAEGAHGVGDAPPRSTISS